MKKQIKKRKSNYRISPFKCLVFINFLLASGLLIHDFIFWGIIPMFKGQFYQLTYLGLFIDFIAFLLVDISIQCFKEWIK
jgi:hypothetical protein